MAQASENEVVILGAGGQAIETAALCRDLGLDVVAFLDEPGYESSRRQLPAAIHTFADAPAELSWRDAVCAVGSPGLRRRWAEAWTPSGWRTLVHPTAHVDPTAELAPGATVCALASVGPHAVIGPHSLVNIAASVAHEAVLGAFGTIGPGARVAGRCRVGDGAFVGIGAVVSDKIGIGEGAVVGAGAVVVGDVDALGVVVGNPAKLLRRAEGWS